MSNKDKVLELLKKNPSVSFEDAKKALPSVRPNVIAIVMKGAKPAKKKKKQTPKPGPKRRMSIPKKGIYSYLQSEVAKAEGFIAKAKSLMELCR